MINDKHLKKMTIDSDKIPISWERQRVEINERISIMESPKKRLVLIHRWVDVVALVVICVIGGWFLINHSITPPEEVAVVEEEVLVKETLPASLIVLNDFDTTETDYEEFIKFIVP